MGAAALSGIVVIAAVAGFLSGSIVRRFGSKKSATDILVITGVLALLPFALHYDWVIDYASSYGARHPDQPAGMYPALRAFQIYVPIAALMWAIAVVASAPRFPFIVAIGPFLFFIFYWSVGIRSLTSPDVGVRLDNVPTILLSFLSLGLSAFGGVFALTVSGLKQANTSGSSDD